MKKWNDIITKCLIVIFTICLLYVFTNSTIIIVNNIKSKDYLKAYSLKVGDKTYSYSIGVEKNECKINTFLIGPENDETTVKYSKGNHKKCVVMQKSHKYLNIMTIITFVLGIGLIIKHCYEIGKRKNKN